ncbi:unnamed protein product, partial [Prorocentrum cordatum]
EEEEEEEEGQEERGPHRERQRGPGAPPRVTEPPGGPDRRSARAPAEKPPADVRSSVSARRPGLPDDLGLDGSDRLLVVRGHGGRPRQADSGEEAGADRGRRGQCRRQAKGPPPGARCCA